jgi:hypothetical protein
MEAPEDQRPSETESGIRDRIARKLRGASSLVLMLSGDGQRHFQNMGDDWQEGFLDTLLDLTEDARELNRRARR